jgi:hypothetical protein
MTRSTVAAAGVLALVLLAGCAGKPSTTVATAATSAAASWASPGYTEMGDVAYRWTSTLACKSYQDGCFGITVITQNGCPNGVYIELAVMDTSGAVVGKANQITAGLAETDVAQETLSPPEGVTKGSKARVSKLNCL